MIVITGRTCSGKDTLGKLLEKEYEFSKVISCTTRPPRPGEENGKDYIFLSNDEYNDMLGMGLFAETTEYKQENGDIWKYATRKCDYKKEKDMRKLYVILNPEGVIQLINQGIHVDIFHLTDDNEPRLRDRYITRELGDTSNMDEMAKLEAKFKVRFAQDTKDFTPYEEGLKDAEKKYPEVDSVNYLMKSAGRNIKSAITKRLVNLGYIEKKLTFNDLEEINKLLDEQLYRLNEENRILKVKYDNECDVNRARISYLEEDLDTWKKKYEEMRKLNENLLNEKENRPIKTDIPKMEDKQITFGSLRHIIPENSIIEFYNKNEGHFILSISSDFFKLLNYDERHFYNRIRIYALKFRFEGIDSTPFVMLQIDINDLKRR